MLGNSSENIVSTCEFEITGAVTEIGDKKKYFTSVRVDK